MLSRKRMPNIKKVVAVLTSTTATLLAILILVLVFGVDQYLFRSDLSGSVVSSQGGDSLQGAEILIQGQTIQSKDNGTFYFPDLRYGVYEIVISKKWICKL